MQVQNVVHRVIRTATFVILTVLSAGIAAAQDAPEWARSLDELMSTQVTSVSRKEQHLADTSAAVFVLTREEIRRSGMTTVPDLLRLVPGLHVAQIDANKWAVSARGFNSRQSNKLLVVIDGRSIYTPNYAGVYWDSIDVPVEGIERIEVVRGPGASIWGANAVNGVINIITAAPPVRRETHAVLRTGTSEPGTVGVRHEGRSGDSVAYRLFGMVTNHGEAQSLAGQGLNDEWNQSVVGGWLQARRGHDTFELSTRRSENHAYSEARSVIGLAPFAISIDERKVHADTTSAQFKWSRPLRNQGSLELDGFVDQWSRRDYVNTERRTFNASIRHRMGVVGRHDFIWGGEYQRTLEHTPSNLTFAITPESFNHDLISGFAQDEIAVVGERGHVVLGTKVEHREFTGWTMQPTARLHWTFTPSQSAWTAVSRAFRAPDRAERGMTLPFGGETIPGSLPLVLAIEGNPTIDGEWLTAYETGYRAAVTRTLTLDLAAYHNVYDGLQWVQPAPPQLRVYAGSPYLAVPLQWANIMDASSTGGEASVVYTPFAAWKLTGGYTLFSMTSRLPAGLEWEGANAPRHQVQLRSSVAVTRRVDLDAIALGVGTFTSVPQDGSAPRVVPRYVRLDGHLRWQLSPAADLTVTGQNLVGPRHFEFSAMSSDVVQFGAVPRAVSVGLGLHF